MRNTASLGGDNGWHRDVAIGFTIQSGSIHVPINTIVTVTFPASFTAIRSIVTTSVQVANNVAR